MINTQAAGMSKLFFDVRFLFSFLDRAFVYILRHCELNEMRGEWCGEAFKR